MQLDYLFHIYTLSELRSIFSLPVRTVQALKHKHYTPLQNAPFKTNPRELRFNMFNSTPKLLSPGYSLEFMAYSLNIKTKSLPLRTNPNYQQYIRSRKWRIFHKIKAAPKIILNLEKNFYHLHDTSIIHYTNPMEPLICDLPKNMIKELLTIPDALKQHEPLINSLLVPVNELPQFIDPLRRLFVNDETFRSIDYELKSDLAKNLHKR